MNQPDFHRHSFLPEAWPFEEPDNAVAFTAQRLLPEGLPILRVAHDLDGEWQFLPGELLDDDKCVVICLGCAFERDRSLAEIASLPRGWRATRVVVGGPWSPERIKAGG